MKNLRFNLDWCRKTFVVTSLYVLAMGIASADSDCPSKATLNVKSHTYTGAYNIELRYGTRPGSKVFGAKSLNGNGTVIFSGVCAGKYFFSFGTTDSEQVSVTQYFDVKISETSYSNPMITVVYTRYSSDGQRVGSAKKRDL